jgi:ABC-2 type transport system permease protein
LPMFMISPALFPLALMPDWLATMAQFNPVTYAVILIRSMMSGYVESSSAVLSIVVLGSFVIAMTLLASYVFTREVNKPF